MGSIDTGPPSLFSCLELRAELLLTGTDRYVAGHLPTESPFRGGFKGYISSEARLEIIDIDLQPSSATETVPDIRFAFIHRSIAIDHETSQVYIQSLLPGDWASILTVGRTKHKLASRTEIFESQRAASAQDTVPGKVAPTVAELNDRASLDAILANTKVSRSGETLLRSQDFLSLGDSYELCLTNKVEIVLPTAGGLNGWALYKRLRQNNPAPFGAFMRLSDVLIVSSSLERSVR